MTFTGGRGPFTAIVTPATATAPEGEDAFGDPIEPESSSSSSAGAGEPWTVPNCRLAPRGSAEDNFQAARVTTEWDLFAPYGASFPVDAHVTVAGLTTRVEGRAQIWRRYGQRGQIIPLKLVEG